MFDNHRIVIRERSYLELLDLSLRVLRAHAAPLAVAVLAGAGPLVALNAWLLGGLVKAAPGERYPGVFLFWMLFLVVWEIPLATAPATIYLGQALFARRPNPKQVVRDFLGSLPQLILYQVLLRGLLLGLIITGFVVFTAYPYLNEVILLERNPLIARGRRSMTTWRRSGVLHRSQGGEFFVRAIGNFCVALVLIGVIWFSSRTLVGVLLGDADSGETFHTVLYPLALWTVAAFFTVVRFLGYLDLRIRREGWEVELSMRAELARWNRFTTAVRQQPKATVSR